ncbi:MAG: hypothetical protein AAFW98_19615, partial [Pseudomonadota bacterium]
MLFSKGGGEGGITRPTREAWRAYRARCIGLGAEFLTANASRWQARPIASKRFDDHEHDDGD